MTFLISWSSRSWSTTRKCIRNHLSSKDPTLEMVDRGVFDDLPDILETRNLKCGISKSWSTTRKCIRNHLSSKDPILEMVDRGVFDDLPDILETWNLTLVHPYTPQLHSCTLLYTVVNCCTLLYIVVHCCTLLYTVVHWCTLLYTVVHCCTMLYNVVHCCTLLYTVVHCCTLCPKQRSGSHQGRLLQSLLLPQQNQLVSETLQRWYIVAQAYGHHV